MRLKRSCSCFGRIALEDEVDVAVLDFKDAFKQLLLHEFERRFLAGTVEVKGVSSCFVYSVVLFGTIAGPLL